MSELIEKLRITVEDYYVYDDVLYADRLFSAALELLDEYDRGREVDRERERAYADWLLERTEIELPTAQVPEVFIASNPKKTLSELIGDLLTQAMNTPLNTSVRYGKDSSPYTLDSLPLRLF